jgi:hypothetical protein
MDRHDSLHKGSRVDLPASLQWVQDPANPEPLMSISRPVLSKLGELLGRIGVFGCALAVVATASLLAMHVN